MSIFGKFFSKVFGGKRAADKARLLGVLNSQKYKFRSLNRLMREINTTDQAYTLGLLEEIGTRREYRDNTLFGLTSRVGEKATRRRVAPSGYSREDRDDSSDDDSDDE